jgi:type IV pilus assembly protein PilA
MLAAIALPAYRDYAMQAQIGEALEVGDVSRKAVEAYFRVNRVVPPSLDAAGAPRPPANAPYHLTMNPQSGLIIIAFDVPPVKDKMIMYAPGLDQAGNLTLLCVNQGVPTKYMRGCNSGQ